MDEGNRRGRRVGIAALAGPVAALILLFAAPSAAAAATLYVNSATGTDSASCGTSTSPCQTIQQAVDNASDGDAIQVAAGTYADVTTRFCTASDNSVWPCSASVVIDKSLTLRGAQAGHPGSAARASASPATESAVTGAPFEIEAPDVTVDGFAFTDPSNQVCIGCDPGPIGVASDVTIENNVFSGYDFSSDYGIYRVTATIGVNRAPDTHVTANYFRSPTADGEPVQWFDGGCSGSEVNNNIFDDADASALADIYFYCDDETVSTITVAGNQDTIGGSSSFVNFQHIGGAGGAEIDVTNNAITMTPASGSSGIYFSTAESGVAKIEVTGNSLTGDPFRAVKLSTNARIPGTVDIAGNNFSNSGVGVYVGANSLAAGASLVLADNELTGESGDSVPDPAAGVELADFAALPASITLTGNDLSGNGVGLYVGYHALAAGASVVLRGNDLAAEHGDPRAIFGVPPALPPAVPLAADGVYNSAQSGGSVDATDNWWGCNAGPNESGCSDAVGDVAYDPWLVLAISASPSTLPTGSSSTITADVTHDSAGNDASASGTIPDGTTIAFTTDLGLLSAPAAGTAGGKASVTLTSPAPGTATVSATLHSQTVSTTVTFTLNLPTSTAQCKNGGWLTFGKFKNQGDCVSFVATHGKNPPNG